MKAAALQVGDKVALAFNVGKLTIVPQLVPGQVYCVCEVHVEWSSFLDREVERVELVGVCGDRRYKYVTDDALPADYFRSMGRSSRRPR